MLRKVARRSTGSADQRLRFTVVELPRGLLHQIKVKKSHVGSNPPGPSQVGSADRDLPGIGTFSCCGSPILGPAPLLMVAIGQ
jgi:hypothetical protein